MNSFEQDMKAAYEQLEKNMDYIASQFNFKKKGYMGENIMILDFGGNKQFNEAQATATTFNNQNAASSQPNSMGQWIKYKGIDFRMVLYSNKKRIAFTF